MKILGTAMQKVRAGTAANEDQIIDALRHLPASKVADLVPDQPWFDAQGEIEEELFKELVASGKRTGSSFPKIRKEVLSYRFDADRPEAAAWAKKESAKLVVEIVEDQRNTIRDFVSSSQMGEFTMTQVARNLRDVVGLTTQQTGWVDNFRNRAISDRMALGDSFEQASARAAAQTERYQQRIHRYRTETIARTEILRANTEGRNQAWQQGIEEGFINAGASKQWSTEIDGRECDICAPLDGETVLISAEFSQGDPPIHPNCRCDVLLVDFADADLEGLTSEQLDSLIDDLLNEQETGIIEISEPPISISTQLMPYEIDPEIKYQGFDENVKGSSKAVKIQVQEDLEKSFAQVAQQDIEIRLSGEALEGVFREGRYRNAYEVNEITENTNYMEQRNNIESKFIGIPTDARIQDRPIYGAIHNPSAAARYGEATIVLRPEVKERTTMGVGDSFNGFNPVPVRDVLTGRATVDDYSRATSSFTWGDIQRGKQTIFESTSTQYWEAQVHGGITVQDIAEVKVPKGWVENLPSNERVALERSGISVITY
jgi:SPP1 gp7 family putative phage head morphogenesis protein